MIFRCIIGLDFLIRGPLCFGFYWAGDVKGFLRSSVPVFSAAEANEATGVQKRKKWVSKSRDNRKIRPLKIEGQHFKG